MNRPIAPIPRSKVEVEGLPAAGSTVVFEGRVEAMVSRARADGTLDLVVYEDGAPMAHVRVPHGLQGWMRTHEVPPLPPPPPPPPTLEELLDAAEARGEKVPRAGMDVVYLYDAFSVPNYAGTQDIRGWRARVLRPSAVDRADLEVFVREFAPLEPDEPDEVQRVFLDVSHDPSGIYKNRYAYPGEFTPAGPVLIGDARPRSFCERSGCENGADPGQGFELMGLRSGRLCKACTAMLVSFLGGADLPPPTAVAGVG